MKQIKCEMCGGTDIVKEQGLFVCQNCGMKYSVEDAKKMMVEGVVEVKGKVKIDRNDNISNYYTMAETAYKSKNYSEAESYCNKIIEIDLNHYQAWLLKGKSAGWQSTVGNKRFAESISCFINAIKNAPDDKKEEVAKDSFEEISNLGKALVNVCGDNFSELPTMDNYESLTSNLSVALKSIIDIIGECEEEGLELHLDEHKSNELEMLRTINNSACDAWKNVLTDFNGDDNRPNHYDYDRYLSRANACFLAFKSVQIYLENLFIEKEDETGKKATIKIAEVVNNKNNIINMVAEILDITPEEATSLVNDGVIKENMALSRARVIKRKLEEAGATITLVTKNEDGEEVEVESNIKINPEAKDLLIQVYKNGITVRTHYMNSCCWKKEYNQYGSYWTVDQSLTNEAKGKCVEDIKELHNKIHDLDPTYVIPNSIKPANNSSGCGTVVVIIIIIIVLMAMFS